MDEKRLIDLWKREEQKPFTGWDFSYLDGRMTLEQPPWSYSKRAAELMGKYSSMIDMGTGGGEWLLQQRKYWPEKVIAIEAYLSNFNIASARLAPLGVQVVNVNLSNDDLMPFPDNEFGLVINRHSGFNSQEVARILANNGTFLTEQIHGLFACELMSAFNVEPQYPEANPEYYLPRVEEAGLKIIEKQEWSGGLKFADVGALVYYLKAIPWIIPGFSVDIHLHHLLTLQNRLENGDHLAFTAKEYLIEAYKD